MATDTASDAPHSATSHQFQAEVAKLLHLMVHSVYSDRDVFLRELVSNAADACEKLRYEAIASPDLLGDDPSPRITVTADKDAKTLVVEDNGVGMSAEEMAEALGTIARSGTKAFVEKLAAEAGTPARNEEERESETGETLKPGGGLIGQFGVGFYSAFMVADKVEVFSRKASGGDPAVWTSDGKGSFSVGPADEAETPKRGTRVVLHLMADALDYAERFTLERIVRNQSGHVPVPILFAEKPGEEAKEIADGAALWVKPKAEVTKEAYADFYRSLSGQWDEPALTVHFRAEGRHEYSALAFVPSEKPFDLFDPDRRGRMKLYVKRVFITDEAEILPRWLRFVRGLVDSADIPLNVSREMIQESPVLAAIKRGVTNRVVSDLEKLAGADAPAYEKVWEVFGPVIKEGLYEDFERRSQLLKLARFRTTAGDGWRSLADYVAAMKENQTAIYYAVGTDIDRLRQSPQLEGYRARGVEVLLLPDPVDGFWTTTPLDWEGKGFKSVTQGAADLDLLPLVEPKAEPSPETNEKVSALVAAFKLTLGEKVADVRASSRLTESAVCLVAPDAGMDRALERLLARTGQAKGVAKPVLEVNPGHELIGILAGLEPASELVAEAARLLLDQARVMDGDQPEDPRAFSERLTRVMTRALRG